MHLAVLSVLGKPLLAVEGGGWQVQTKAQQALERARQRHTAVAAAASKTQAALGPAKRCRVKQPMLTPESKTPDPKRLQDSLRALC